MIPKSRQLQNQDYPNNENGTKMQGVPKMKIISKFKITPKNKNGYNTEKYPQNENNSKNELLIGM